jgi:hypothetical protein
VRKKLVEGIQTVSPESNASDSEGNAAAANSKDAKAVPQQPNCLTDCIIPALCKEACKSSDPHTKIQALYVLALFVRESGGVYKVGVGLGLWTASAVRSLFIRVAVAPQSICNRCAIAL